MIKTIVFLNSAGSETLTGPLNVELLHAALATGARWISRK